MRIHLWCALCVVIGALVATPAHARPPADPDTRTIAVTGDLLIHAPVWERARINAGGRGYDFAPMLARIRPLIGGAELALCHLETPLGPGPPAGYPVFNTPPALARAIRTTGFDVCSTASNHSLDRGPRGVASTLAALDRAGVRHTGTARSAAESARPVTLDAGGVPIAFIAATAVAGQPPSRSWLVNQANTRTILTHARRARAAGARAVIVNLHGGDEYDHNANATQAIIAGELMRSPLVTAVIGQHAHVVQRISAVGGTPVLFGAGNLLSNQSAAAGLPAATQDGLIGLLRLHIPAQGPARLARVDYAPTYVRRPDYVVVPVGADRTRPEYRRSYARTVGIIGHGAAYGPWRPLRPWG